MSEAVSNEALQDDLANMTLPSLCKKYVKETSVHRNILLQRGVGISGNWRDFRAFLNDLGPWPGEGYNLVLLNRFERTYGPGRARWMNAEEQAAHEEEFDRQQAAKAEAEAKRAAQEAAMRRATPAGQPGFGQWTSMGGRTVSYTDVAKKLAIPVGALSKTLKDGRTPDDLVRQMAATNELLTMEAAWLPPDPDKRAGFYQAFRVWHLQVQPQFAKAATPAFLFLFIALPIMKECRDTLIALNLWTPLGQRAEAARDAHVAWKKYTEFMPKAQVALMDIPIYATYSLLTELDALCDRIIAAEHRFRAPPKAAPVRTHREVLA